MHGLSKSKSLSTANYTLTAWFYADTILEKKETFQFYRVAALSSLDRCQVSRFQRPPFQTVMSLQIGIAFDDCMGNWDQFHK